MTVPDTDESMRRAAARAQAREDGWNHPERPDLEGAPEAGPDGRVFQACADAYCRHCRDQDGEVRDGFAL